MQKRQYGKQNVMVSRIGFGAWPLGNTAHGKTMSEETGIALVNAALEGGVNFFDTAPNYAHGRSETILGKALGDKRNDVVINTKFGHHPDGTIDFNAEKIEPSIRGSLKRLQTDHLDSVLLHNPDPSILKGETAHFDILSGLKAKGIIKAYGVSVDTPEELSLALKRDDIEVIELLFNIFSQSTREHFDRIKAKRIALIIKVPLDSGWLSGKYHKDMVFTDIRSRWTKDDLERRHALCDKLKKLVGSDRLTPYAINFILSFDAVTTVIPGIRTTEQLSEHLRSIEQPLDAALKEKLMRFYDDEIDGNPLPW